MAIRFVVPLATPEQSAQRGPDNATRTEESIQWNDSSKLEVCGGRYVGCVAFDEDAGRLEGTVIDQLALSVALGVATLIMSGVPSEDWRAELPRDVPLDLIVGPSGQLAGVLALLVRGGWVLRPALTNLKAVWATGTVENDGRRIGEVEHLAAKLRGFVKTADELFVCPQASWTRDLAEAAEVEGVTELTIERLGEMAEGSSWRGRYVVPIPPGRLPQLLCALFESAGATAWIRDAVAVSGVGRGGLPAHVLGEQPVSNGPRAETVESPATTTADLTGRGTTPHLPVPRTAWIRPRTAIAITIAAICFAVAVSAPSWTRRAAPIERTRAREAGHESRFGRNEIGVLVEQSSFGSFSRWEVGVDALRTNMRQWTRVFEGRLDRYGWPYDRQSFVVRAVPRVTDDIVTSSGAVIGLMGAFEERRDDTGRSAFFMRAADTAFSVRGLLPELTQDDIAPVRVVAPRRYIIDYVNEMELPLAAARALLRTSARRPARLERWEAMAEFRFAVDGASVGVQNLNQSFGPEFGLLTAPRQTLGATRIGEFDELDMDAVRELALSAYGLRLILRRALGNRNQLCCVDPSALPAWLGDDYRSVPLAINPPLPVRRYLAEIQGDLLVLAAYGSSLAQDLSAVPGVSERGRSRLAALRANERAYIIRGFYERAAAVRGPVCLSCVVALVQLALSVGDFDSAKQDIDNAIPRAEGLDKLRLTLMGARLAMIGLSNIAVTGPGVSAPGEAASAGPCDRTLMDARRALDYLARVRRLGSPALADFEEARLGMAIGPTCGSDVGLDADGVEVRLRRVLQAHPHHLLTRFLLAKVLDSQQGARAAAAELAILQQDSFEHTETYAPEYHSLGEGDDVHHTVEPVAVLADFVRSGIADCRAPAVVAAIRHVPASVVPGFRWSDIVGAANEPLQPAAYFVFPFGGVTVRVGQPVASTSWCAEWEAARREVLAAAESRSRVR